MLEHLTETDGRNDWRRYMNERDEAYKVIDEAFEFMSKCASEKKEIDWKMNITMRVLRILARAKEE